ncbi:MAG TPA: hypothetical protein VFH31_02010 [Pyrinomonadaceae bacterium]|nr:hypothetical protein [Pyrinomonadaceae bacterium]
MKIKRMTSADRDKQLGLAISRIERGRARTKATDVTIASVAREAGVSTALIHNHHPDRAEEIREKQGRSSRAQRDAKHSELKAEQAKNKELRTQADALRLQIAKLASINEVLTMEVRTLKSSLASKNIATIDPTKKR